MGAIFALTWLLPVLFALTDRYVVDYRIGPLVFFYSVASLLVFCGASTWGLAPRIGAVKALIAGGVIGVLGAILLLNFFIGITSFLGIKDYDVM